MLPLSHLHPFISHFPIALIIFALIFEIIGMIFKKQFYLQMSKVLLIIGTLSAILAVLSGVFLTEEPIASAEAIYQKHKFSSFMTVALGITSSSLKLYVGKKYPDSKRLTIISFLVLIALFFAVCISGYYGGALVYDYMISIR